MNGYERTTRECRVDEIQGELREAIREYFRGHGLGEPEAETRRCCETITVKRETSGLFSFLEGEGDQTSHLAILLTPDWLVWGRKGDRTGMVVSGAKLKVIRTKIMIAKRSKDIHLDISGFINDTKDYVKGTLELGPQAAAQAFCEEATRLNLEANPLEKKSGRRWFGV